jgi:acyl dehydratase
MSQDMQAGTVLFTQTVQPVDRTMLALYAGGSNDHTPVHYDIDAARAFGFDDVFSQGMCAMALLGRTVTDHVPPDRLRHYRARFVAKTLLGDRLTCTATVEEHLENGDTRLSLTFANQHDQVKLKGEAVIIPAS